MTLIYQQQVAIADQTTAALTAQNRDVMRRLRDGTAILESSLITRRAQTETIAAMTTHVNTLIQMNVNDEESITHLRQRNSELVTCLAWEMRMRLDLERRLSAANLLPPCWPDHLREGFQGVP